MACTEAYREHIMYSFNAFCIVYDYSAKSVKCVFDMLLVCFCTIHKQFPLWYTIF